MATRKRNRALAYLRRSTDRQEISLASQLEWALAEAGRHSVAFDASSADLIHMQVSRLSSFKDLRLDDGITGADLTRPGFVALISDARGDRSVSHLLINRRDRFARPEDAIKMVSIEKDLRLEGLTIVFAEAVAEPLVRGRTDLAADIAMMFGYYESGEFLRKHAERVLLAQRQLALGGYRVGGNAPYGFVRALVDSSGRVLEELLPGRQVRQPGCHVRIVPKDHEKIAVWLTVLELNHMGWGCKRIARHLNDLGIPSPGAGTMRTDQGVRHEVSGKWGPNTVKELCDNRAILGLQDYGRRSEGAHRRLDQEGHRLLTDADRDANDRPRVVRNDPEAQITASIGSPAQFDADRWDQIQRQRQARGRSQRGIPRAKNPARFPLSCRIVDLTDGCGSIMYGYQHGGRPIYVCGSYMRTAGAECEHNLVDAEAVLRFTLRTLCQQVERCGNREKLRALLEERARHEADHEQPTAADHEVGHLEATLGEKRTQLITVQRRMATEQDDNRYEALCTEFDRIRSEASEVETRLESRRKVSMAGSRGSMQQEIEAAMALFDDINRISTDERARAEINPMLVRLGLRLGLTFTSAIKGKKRVVRQLVGGIMAFGDASLPVPLHGTHNAEMMETTLETRRENRLIANALDNPEGLASNNVHGQPDRLDRAEAGTDASSIPASGVSIVKTQSVQSLREGVSFTKDSRGGGI